MLLFVSLHYFHYLYFQFIQVFLLKTAKTFFQPGHRLEQLYTYAHQGVG